jgi:hypothetical protein
VRSTRAAPFLFLAFIAGLGWRAVERALTPPFEPGLVHRRQTRLAIDGLALACARAAGARITLRAASARPGHLELGPFELAPPTSLALEGVVVEIASPTNARVVVRGKSGEMRGREVEVKGDAVIEREGSPEQRCHLVRVDLASGEVSSR